MRTKELSVSLQFDQTTVDILSALAERENKSLHEIIQILMQEALDDREDRALSKLAARRDL